jgi:hypothetical protein
MNDLSDYPKRIENATSSDEALKLNREYSQKIIEEVASYADITNKIMNEHDAQSKNISK